VLTRRHHVKRRSGLPTLVLGAGQAGREMVRALRQAQDYGLVPVAFLADFLSLTTTSISDKAITIVNNSPLPFCTTSLPCADVFDGFAFTFSGGLPITSVTVDPGSSADFLPVSLAFNATAILRNSPDPPALSDVYPMLY